MDKVLLITPPYHCGVVESAGRWPNLGFTYIAGALRKAGFDPVIYDAMSKFHGYPEIRATIEDVKPRFVASTAYTATINDAVKVLALAKEVDPSVITLVGGIHPTFCYEEVLSEHGDAVDFCVLGEGELTAPELLRAIAAGEGIEDVLGVAFRRGDEVVRTPPRPLIEDLDSLEPAWDLVEWNDYPLYFIDDSRVAIVSSSRGCSNKCSFCSQHKFWGGTYRERDARRFTDEIEKLHREYDVNVFFIADEYPTRNAARWDAILELLIAKALPIHILIETHVDDIVRDRELLWKYRKAGILFIYTGVEATEPGRFATFKKEIGFEKSREAIRLIKEAGMISESSLILGMPDETKETIRDTFELAKIYDADYMHFLMIAPWPYADLYAELEPFVEEKDYSRYNLVEPIVKPARMTRQEVLDAVLRCYMEYYRGKMPRWLAMEDGLKKSCLIKGMKAIMENSFLTKHMKGDGGMPEEMRRLLEDVRGA